MSSKENSNKTDQVAKIMQPTDSTVEVLYQKLGDKWYAFSVIGEDVFFSSVPEELPPYSSHSKKDV